MSQKHLVYGLHAVSAALGQESRQIAGLYCLAGREDQRLQQLKELASQQGIPIVQQSRQELTELAGQAQHQGVVALLHAPLPPLNEHDLWFLLETLTEDPFLLVLDEVQDPHNLGACLRTAAVAGVHAVVIPKKGSAQITPAVRKVACGGAESVPLIVASNLARVLTELKNKYIWIYGACLEGSQSIYQSAFTGPLALVLGAEARGLRRLTREHCDGLFHIPQFGQVDSLNVSVATGVCLFEAIRQRLASA